MGDDIAALLDHLNISQADIVGLSLGAAVGLRTAIQHSEKVHRLVVISSPYAKSGWYPEAQEGMGRVSAAMAGNMMQTPTGKFSRNSARLPGFVWYVREISRRWPDERPRRVPPFVSFRQSPERAGSR
jgi:pimeloyl-ACP methyl ester carboxylesterase